MTSINIKEIIQLAQEAGELILEVYAKSEGIVIDRKADDSPLTEADTRANDHIVAGLSRLYPEIPIISEEEKLIPYETRSKWTTCWEVDPLDGTKEFIKRNGEFTVNIALIEEGRPVAGVIYAPVLDQMAWATEGSGAWMTNSKADLERYFSGEHEPVKLQSRTPAEGEKIKVVASRSHNSPEMDAYLATFKDPEIRSSGSSLKLLLVAKGEAHIYPRLAPTMEWDISAGHAILNESGGEIVMMDASELRYNREDLRNPHFIAYAEGMRSKLDQYLK